MDKFDIFDYVSIKIDKDIYHGVDMINVDELIHMKK